MASVLPNFEYDIFISYRHNDNRSGWVTEFVNALQEELAATIKEPLNIYFDKNPHDGLLETHDVDDSLKQKLKCLIFIPIISQTYCDPKCFAWRSEFLVFLKMAAVDSVGLKVKLANGNISSRILPIRIHELDASDRQIIESELGPLRAIDFTYHSTGVNRPLLPKDDETARGSQNIYRDQVNKTANAIKEILAAIQRGEGVTVDKAVTSIDEPVATYLKPKKVRFNPTLKTILSIGLLLSLILIALWYYMGVKKSDNKDFNPVPSISSIILPDSIPLNFMSGPLRVGRRGLGISPDGKIIAFVSMDSTGISYLNIRLLADEKLTRLPETEGAFAPIFSPDSKWIAFFVNDKLCKISVDGSVKQIIANTANPVDGIWDSDDRIVWSANEGATLYSIQSNGKDFKSLKSSMRFYARSIQISKDHYLANNSVDETYLISFEKGVQKLIFQSGSYQAYYNGELFFINGNDLFAIRFDMESQSPLGNPRIVKKGISVDSYKSGQFSISQNGTLVYAAGTHTQLGQLAWYYNGSILNLPFEPEVYGTFSLSPDDKNIVIVRRGEKTEIWNYDIENPSKNIQLSQYGFANGAIWSPSSNVIYYHFYRDGDYDVYKRDASGRSESELVLKNDSIRAFLDVNDNGILLCTIFAKDGTNRLSFYSSDGSPVKYLFSSKKGFNESLSKFIPNDWLAFTSDQTGRSEVFIADLFDPSVRIQVSFDGGEEPRYNEVDKTLYYRNKSKLMGISLNFDAKRKAILGTPRVIFEDDYWINVAGYSYDIASDGKHFLFVRAVSKRETNEIKVIQNLPQ